MNFKETIGLYKGKVENELGSYFDAKEASFKYKDDFVTESIKLLKDYTLRGGKRGRPTLTIMAYRGYSGDLSDTKILKPAMSWEFMQSYLLTHDDLMDNAPIRRGKETPHVWVKNWYKKRINENEDRAKQFGNNIAIVLGDLFNHFGIDAILNSNFDETRKLAAIKIYNDTAERTGRGQVLDSWFSDARGKSLTEQEHYEVIDRKTVEYTVKRPVLMGATLAGLKDEKEFELLEKATFPLGRAFQLQDDLLDYFADEAKLKKKIMTDIREGKYTIMLIKAFENATPEQAKRLKGYMGKQSYTQEEIDDIRQIMRDTGSLDYSKKLINENVEEAKKYISQLHSTQEFKDFLNDYADYLTIREY